MSYNKVGISFFGHRNIAAETAKTVEKKLFDYLNDFVCFYIRQNKKIVCFCGGYGLLLKKFSLRHMCARPI